MKNLERVLVFVMLLGTIGLMVLSAGCSSTPRVENVRAVRGQEPYQFGQAPEQRIIENGGKQYDRHVRSLQDARLRHEETMVRMEYERREREYARTNGLSSPQSALPPSDGQRLWPITRPPVGFPPPPVFVIGPDDLVAGFRPVRQIRDLNGGGFCPPPPPPMFVHGPGRYSTGGGFTTSGGYTANGGYLTAGGGFTTMGDRFSTAGGFTTGNGGITSAGGRFSTAGSYTTSGGYRVGGP